MPKILVIEDVKALRETLVRIAKEFTNEVIEVDSLEDAIQKLQDESFDVVITDVRLPDGEEGIDILDSVGEKYPDTKVIVITSRAPVQWLSQRAMMRGAYDYIDRTNPITPYIPALRESIEKALSEPS